MSQTISLNDFYKLVTKNRNLKRRILKLIIENKHITKEEIADFKKFKDLLKDCSDKEQNINIKLDDGTILKTNLAYELSELENDLFFLKEKDLSELFQNKFSFFNKEVKIVLDFFNNVSKFNLFITDRDGTINNYCSRYKSCIQSLYNAFYINKFVNNKTKESVMVTSAPLINHGIIDSILDLDYLMIYSASKGREFYDHNGIIHRYPVCLEKQKILDLLNLKLDNLLKQKEFKIFKFIGSGFQIKFGQTTIARQDITGSIKNDFSNLFLSEINKLVKSIDPTGEYLKIEDTGKDIEIILTLEGVNREFDKADGLDFISKKLNLNFNRGPNLVCGDTASDIPLLKHAINKNKETFSVFVTNDENLKEKVKNLSKDVVFVSTPDVLVYSLYKYSKE